MESLGHSIVQTCKALDLDASNYIQGNGFELSSFLEDVSASSNEHNQQIIQELEESFKAKYQGE